MDINIRLRLLNDASRGILSSEEQIRRSQQRLTAASRRAAQEEAQAAESAQQAIRRSHFQTESARAVLGMRSNHTIQREISQTIAAYNRLARSGTISANELARAQQLNIDRVRQLRQEMGETERMAHAGMFNSSIGTLAGVAAGSTAVVSPVMAAAREEEAKSNLKIAMMDINGTVTGAYADIIKQAVELGNRLPLDTTDTVNAAIALKKQGMPETAMAGGGLKAAAEYAVLAERDTASAATSVAKNREAFGLKDNELPAMATAMIQGSYAFGIPSQDYEAVAAYAAPMYNALGLTGIENARKLIAIQGMNASVGLEGSSFGTSMAMMLSRLKDVDKNLSGKDAADERAILAKRKIKLDFYDKNGNFAGLENMLANLDKLKPLSPEDRAKILDKLFATEGSRPAANLIQKGGLAGLETALALYNAQPTNEQRIAQKTSTTLAAQDTAVGTLTNVKASMGSQTAETYKGVLNSTSTGLSYAQSFFDENPDMGTKAMWAGGLGATALFSSAPALIAPYLPQLKTLASAAVKGSLTGLIGDIVGTLTVDAVTDKDSKANRYGHSMVEGAAIGGAVGMVATPIGGATGALAGGFLGLVHEMVANLKAEGAFKPVEFKHDFTPLEIKNDITVNLAPGLVLQSKSSQATGAQVVPEAKTGNIWTGAPK